MIVPYSIPWFNIIYMNKLFITTWKSAQLTYLLIRMVKGKGESERNMRDGAGKECVRSSGTTMSRFNTPQTSVASSATKILSRINPDYGTLDFISAI